MCVTSWERCSTDKQETNIKLSIQKLNNTMNLSRSWMSYVHNWTLLLLNFSFMRFG